MTQTATARRVPNIQKPPAAVNASVIHYGYTAYNDINLNGPTGIAHDVQPGDSPFRTILPAKELIPFVTYQTGEIDSKMAASIDDMGPGILPVRQVTKTAFECVQEITRAYQMHGFRNLEPLTGLDEEDAWHIFQTIQPFLYKLKDIEYELTQGAKERIAKTEPYRPFYENAEMDEDIEPLPAHLKETAEKTRAVMAASASQATTMASNIVADSTTKIEQYFATGKGKRTADPHDHFIFEQMGAEIPSVFNKTPNRTTPEAEESYLKQIADAMSGRGGEDSERVAKLEKQIADMAAMLGQTGASPLSTAPTKAPPAETAEKCIKITNAGTQCKFDAVDGLFCKKHS